MQEHKNTEHARYNSVKERETHDTHRVIKNKGYKKDSEGHNVNTGYMMDNNDRKSKANSNRVESEYVCGKRNVTRSCGA